MGTFDDLIERTNKMIDEVEYSDNRSQELYEKFVENRNDLEDAIVGAHGNEEKELTKLLKLLNRKGEENDMENW
ncbi:MAG: hypothetical protein CMC70_04210 [Flavobacteriaceae bacterium]|nr:hypothetical protein [Flavobacteriaceae bacterium]|tara:strand:+ start:194 stop:415 length:222 start_codon:yes stop_codon:yes gene_type:complete